MNNKIYTYCNRFEIDLHFDDKVCHFIKKHKCKTLKGMNKSKNKINDIIIDTLKNNDIDDIIATLKSNNIQFKYTIKKYC